MSNSGTALMMSLALAAWALGISASAQSQPQLPKIVQDAIDEVSKQCLPERFQSLAGFVVERDINGDGRKDYILNYGNSECGDPMTSAIPRAPQTYYCGTGGCLTQVFASRDNGSYELVLDNHVRQVRFARKNGRPAMLLDWHGMECGRAGAERCSATLYWNGYRFSPAN